MHRSIRFLLPAAALLLAARQPARPAAPTVADDLTYLRRRGPVHLLTAPGGGVVLVSPQYQGRVMTSGLSLDGRSIGWVNRAFIDAGKRGTAFDNYGGEDRFWLGPEAGQFGLYFPAGKPFELAHWQVPAALNDGEWTVTSRSDTSVTLVRPMRVRNYAGAEFELRVDRTVRLLGARDLSGVTGDLPPSVRWIGYETINRVTNTGRAAWTRERGLPSVWILGMYNTFGTSHVIVPYRGGRGERAESIVNARYFNAPPPERLRVRDGVVLFTADGRFRSKLGIGPRHAAPTMGSWAGAERLLTVVHFDLPPDAASLPYVNSMWERQRDPYAGDVVNAYNDGPPNPGGFYELESSSPALALAPGASHTHRHRTVHLTGPAAALDAVARRSLGTPVSALGR